MGLTDWMGTFGRAQSLDLSHDLERGYEAALLIQSIEMEYYNDRPVRPEIELRIPKAMQAQVLRRFRTALQICRDSQLSLEVHRHELAGQEMRDRDLERDCIDDLLSDQPRQRLHRWNYRQRPES